MTPKYLILPLLPFLSACYSPAQNTVMITNVAGNSGGSGSIVSHSVQKSTILTNAHVCQVVINGGQIITENGRAHHVHSYKISTIHDLCQITVLEDLGSAAHLSAMGPLKFGAATVLGHPKLYPTIKTEGHFSDKVTIPVLSGFRECTASDREDSVLGYICELLGQIPIIKTYEAIVVTPLIQPGSSGSAVYGNDGGISAVIFAGSGDIGFGFAVPYEYVAIFLGHEVDDLEEKFPKQLASMKGAPEDTGSNTHWRKKIKDHCEKPKNKKHKGCKAYLEAFKYHDMVK